MTNLPKDLETRKYLYSFTCARALCEILSDVPEDKAADVAIKFISHMYSHMRESFGVGGENPTKNFKKMKSVSADIANCCKGCNG